MFVWTRKKRNQTYVWLPEVGSTMTNSQEL